MRQEFNALNPFRSANRKVHLNRDQINWMLFNLYDDSGRLKLFCKKHILDMTNIGSPVYSRLTLVAAMKSELGSGVADKYFQLAKRSPIDFGYHSIEYAHPWIIPVFQKWMHDNSQPIPVSEKSELCCYVGKRSWAAQHFKDFLALEAEKQHLEPIPLCRQTFKRLWDDYAADIEPKKLSKDKCNLCFMYADFVTAYNRFVGHLSNPEDINLPCNQHWVEQRADWEEKRRQHITEALSEREQYRLRSSQAKSDLDGLLRCDVPAAASDDGPTSDALLVLSVDAMKIGHFPHIGARDQPNQIYFINGVKFYLMGVFDEGANKGYAYLWDQTATNSQGVNSGNVIHTIFTHILRNWIGQDKLALVFDNCSVNKNYWVTNHTPYLLQQSTVSINHFFLLKIRC